jgi:hypothetical protein
MFARSLVELTPLIFLAGDDQVVWNELLRHPSFRQMSWELLPRSQFIDLNSGTAATVPPGRGGVSSANEPVFLVHAVGGDKISRLRKVRQWYLTLGKCDFFDRPAVVGGVDLGALLDEVSHCCAVPGA